MENYIYFNSVINELSDLINIEPITLDNQMSKINDILVNKNQHSENKIIKLKFNNNNLKFKFNLVNCLVYFENLFNDNINIVSDDNYENIIYLELNFESISIDKVFSDFGLNFNDDKITRNSQINFSSNDINYVNNYLPNNKFIIINFLGEKNNKEIIQNLINTIYNIYGNYFELIQVIPNNIDEDKFILWDNVTSILDLFSFQESLIFMKNASLVISLENYICDGILFENYKIPKTIVLTNKKKSILRNKEILFLLKKGWNNLNLINFIEISNKILDPKNIIPKNIEYCKLT